MCIANSSSFRTGGYRHRVNNVMAILSKSLEVNLNIVKQGVEFDRSIAVFTKRSDIGKGRYEVRFYTVGLASELHGFGSRFAYH